MTSAYSDVYQSWRKAPLDFWRAAAQAIDWIKPPDKIFDPEAGVYGHWFPDATCNTAFNCVDRHVNAGCGAQTAIIYDSPVTGAKRKVSYAELLDQTRRLAGVLRGMGVAKGDRVIIYMPMVPEAVTAMLACARIGAVHSVVFGGFAAKELATRIDDAKPKLILAANCGIEPGRIVEYLPLLSEAVALSAHKPEGCLVLHRAQSAQRASSSFARDWDEAMEDARVSGVSADCAELKAKIGRAHV